MDDWYENNPTAAPRTVIPAKAGIQCLSPSKAENKPKTLDPRLLMSRMTVREQGKDTGCVPHPGPLPEGEGEKRQA